MTATKKPIERGFILAAGMGTRLRPLTDHLPKPMVCVGGKPIIDYALDALARAGVREVVVNLHHKGEILETHLAPRKSPKITLSWEKDLLDTGGGVKKALDFFQNDAFYLLNGDALWQDAPGASVLDSLGAAWDPARMDALILVSPAARIPGGSGDYDMDPDGHARRSPGKTGAQMFTGLRIVHPRLFDETPDGAFSFLTLLDRAEKTGRLYGMPLEGIWHHISTPEDRARSDAAFTSGRLAQKGS